MDETKTNQASGSTPENSGKGEFQAAEFQEVNAGATATRDGMAPNIDVIMDVPVTLSLEVGRTEMSVGKLLRLTQGAVVELDRNAGEPLDVMVNGALIAHGEIVVVNDKFGIRLIDVITPAAKALVESAEA